MQAKTPWSDFIGQAAMANRRDVEVTLTPDAEVCAAIAAHLDLTGLRKLRLTGRLTPEGRNDWRFDGTLGASVTQACVVSGAPVATRIDRDVARHWMADTTAPEGEEMEMPDDVSIDPLPHLIDMGAVMVEDLSLALPDFPRAQGATLDALHAGPEETDDSPATSPFAGLAQLRPQATDTDDET